MQNVYFSVCPRRARVVWTFSKHKSDIRPQNFKTITGTARCVRTGIGAGPKEERYVISSGLLRLLHPRQGVMVVK